MITPEAITAILAAIGAVVGSGGITAIIHEMSVRKKIKSDVDSEKSENTTELMKYLTEEIKRVNNSTNEQLNRIQEENTSLKKEMATLNSKITELVKWIMYDNANYRGWLEKNLKNLDPNISFPPCAEPPVAWNTDKNDSQSE